MIMESAFQKRLSTLAFSLASAVTSLPAISQDDQAEQGMLEEIVVTARKREESLQESPVAVSAFSAETLRESGVSTMRDLSTAVPGLSFSEQSSKAPSIFIRGVGQRESNAALDPGVGVYINGIYIARTDTQLFDTVDTESIQVLRGPQGTLFGKNTTGGAMLVTTKSPNTEEFSGTFGTKLGNYNRRDGKLFLNIPLNDDTLSMRAAVSSVKRDGYTENVLTGRYHGDEDRLAASTRILWEATDNFSADLFTYVSKQNENGFAGTCIFMNDAGRIAGQQRFPGQGSELTSYKDACLQSEALADHDKIAIGDSVFRLQNQISALTLAWQLDDIEIKSITAIGKQTNIVTEDDLDATAISVAQSGTITKQTMLTRAGYDPKDEERTQFSEEINLIGSAFDESLSYTIGAFISKENMSNTQFLQTVGPNTFAMALQAPNDLSSNTGIGTHKFLGTVSDIDTETSALFAQGTYDVKDWFQLTLGGRYTVEKRKRDLDIYSVDWNQLVSNINDLTGLHTSYLYLPGLVEGIHYGSVSDFNTAYAANPVIPLRLNVNERPADAVTGIDPDCPIGGDHCDQAEKTWRKFTPAITASFNNLQNYIDLDNLDSAMVYFTFSKGFKAGGFEPKGSSLVAFDPEQVTNYEIGTKVDAFDHRLRVNAALYYMDYSDIQVRVAEKGPLLTDLYVYLSNAGQATIKGYELEVFALPMENLTIAATFNYTDASYDEFTTSEVGTVNGLPGIIKYDRSREPMGSTPKKSGSLSASYNINTEAAGIFVPRLSVYHRDEIYLGNDYVSPNFDKTTVPSYTLLSARLMWLPDDQWNVSAFVDNITDKDYLQGGFAQPDLMGGGDFVKGAPRLYGVEMFYEF